MTRIFLREDSQVNKTIIEMNADTRMLIDLLRTISPGAVVTYLELSGHIERNVQTVARGSLNTARKTLRKEGVLFDVIRGVGLRRMLPDEIAKGVPAKYIKKIGNASKRCLQDLHVAAQADLDNESRVKLNAGIAMFGTIRECVKPKQIKKLEKAIKENNNKELAIGTTLESFKR